MATLPDGTSVSLQDTEDYESFVAVTSRIEDSFESGSFAAYSGSAFKHYKTEPYQEFLTKAQKVTIAASDTVIPDGGTVTVSGQIQDSAGVGISSVNYTVLARDASSKKQITSKSGAANASGEYTEDLTLTNAGDYDLLTQAHRIKGKQTSDSFESGTFASYGGTAFSLHITEGWES